MGTSFFKGAAPPAIGKGSSAMNMQARAIGAPTYAGAKAGAGAAKDIAAAAALNKASPKAATKTAASNAPGPKKV
jgi:hypothetical protein